MNITIKKGNLTLDFKEFIFPGGEVGIKLNATLKEVFRDGKLLIDYSLSEIRARVTEMT